MKSPAFSQSPLIGSLSNLQIMRTGIKAQTSSHLGQIGLFTLELFTLECGFLFMSLTKGEGDILFLVRILLGLALASASAWAWA